MDPGILFGCKPDSEDTHHHFCIQLKFEINEILTFKFAERQKVKNVETSADYNMECLIINLVTFFESKSYSHVVYFLTIPCLKMLYAINNHNPYMNIIQAQYSKQKKFVISLSKF